MSTIKHPDTYVCDICGAEFAERRKVNVPVVWTTEQTEGRFCEPYYGVECLDLCEECVDSVHVVEAAGAQGLNRYVFRKRAERTTTRNGKFKTKYGNKIPLCECCGYSIGDKRYNFCPNCGAKVVDE